jgi:hypothetical protein
VFEDGVAGEVGVAADLVATTGPKGTSVLTGTAFDCVPGMNAGSELSIWSSRPAYVLRCYQVNGLLFEIGTPSKYL